MKTTSLTVLFFLFSITVFSQKNMDDVVYLKNGSKIQGSILQLYPDSIVQIKQLGGSVWIFSMKEVTMIAKEEKTPHKALISNGKGYQFGMDAGFLIGSQSSQNVAPVSVHMIHSYRIIPSLATGIGAGLEFFEPTQIPLYLDLRYYFNRKFYAPFLFIQSGTMLPLGKEISYSEGWTFKGKVGYMINSGIGFLFPMSEKSAFSVSFSYRFQELLYERKNYQLTDYTRVEQMNRFNLRFGFLLR
jgi:hypothetical protein